MSQYLVLSHIKVQNANSIAGLTWGFPAITSFLGFTHALNRYLSKHHHEIVLSGCAIISNHHNQHTYHDTSGNIRFTQRTFSYTFKPKYQNGEQKKPSTIEEGKLNLTTSLVIEIKNPLSLTNEQRKELELQIKDICLSMRLAGGTLLSIKKVKLFSASTEDEKNTILKKIKQLIMPGFVLLDRKEYLAEYYQKLQEQNPNVELLDAWLDFSALIYKAIPEEDKEPTETTKAEWQYQPKPYKGYLVPLMTGFKAISELYAPNQVKNIRDTITPTRFVEAIHSIGEWQGAHRITNLEDIMWHYQYDDQWYLCVQKEFVSDSSQTTKSPDFIEEFNNLTEIDALNLF